MTQPNRLATLAVRLPAALGPRRYVYAAPNFLNVNFENGEWYIGQGNTQLQPPRLASTMVLADDISIALTDSLGESPDPLVIVAGSQIFIFGPSGFLTFNIVSRAGFTGNNYQFLVVTGGTLTGDDFQVTAGLTLGFSGTTTLQPGPTENREVWARINERGAETGILAINTTETVSVVTETAELVIRFIDPSTYERLLSITDDLGREWEIRSFRSLEDRRNLALECQRDATS